MTKWKTMSVLVEIPIQSTQPISQTVLNQVVEQALAAKLDAYLPITVKEFGRARAKDPRRSAQAKLQAAQRHIKAHPPKAQRVSGSVPGAEQQIPRPEPLWLNIYVAPALWIQRLAPGETITASLHRLNAPDWVLEYLVPDDPAAPQQVTAGAVFPTPRGDIIIASSHAEATARNYLNLLGVDK